MSALGNSIPDVLFGTVAKRRNITRIYIHRGGLRNPYTVIFDSRARSSFHLVFSICRRRWLSYIPGPCALGIFLQWLGPAAMAGGSDCAISAEWNAINAGNPGQAPLSLSLSPPQHPLSASSSSASTPTNPIAYLSDSISLQERNLPSPQQGSHGLLLLLCLALFSYFFFFSSFGP